MNNKFDELTKQMAQSVTRRAALKKFGVGLAGMALACFGLANNAGAGSNNKYKCVSWHCGGQGWFLPVYICGGGKPIYPAHCTKVGVVDCSYSGCC